MVRAMKEQVSELMDGELPAEQCEGCVKRIEEDPRLREQSWDLYHLIGDALRGHLVPGVVHQVRARLAAEQPIVAPQRARARPPRRMQWYGLSAAATVVAVAFVGWTALPLFDVKPGQSEPAVAKIAAVQPPPAVVPTAHGMSD